MKHLTIVFKNAIQLEGYLISLNNNEMIIKSLDKITEIIIPNVNENILFYKIDVAEENFLNLADKPIKTQEDLVHLVTLKGKLLDIERSTIKENLQAPIKKAINVERYQPIHSTIQYSAEKTPRANNQFAAGLQGMFSKKNQSY